MATGPGVPGATNVYIPNWEASGRLATGFARNVKDFLVNQYVTLIESPKPRGYWMKINSQEAARVVTLQDYAWAYGKDRPMREEGLESFTFNEFTVNRWDFGFNLAHEVEDFADWNVGEQHAKIHAAKAMTARAINVLTVATTASNWQTSSDTDMSSHHTATAASLVGGYVDQGTAVIPLLKKALDKIAVLINLDTLGVVEPKDLVILMNPNTARLLAESPEVHEYIKGSPAALDEIRSASSPNARYGTGLPSTIYGYKIIVENTVQVTSRKAATLAKSYVMPDQTILVVARPGALEGVYGLPSFSAITVFWNKDEMTLERFDDVKNRRMEYHVVDSYVPVVTAPLGGFLLTSATSVAS